MNINLIAAIGQNYELGKNGDLIWKLREDLNFFKETTMGSPIVMGRKTFESLPKVLPGRKNIVISSKKINNNEIELYKSIKEFLLNYKEYNADVFIIGGASIYEQFIDLATSMYLTEIKAIDKEADVYYPKFNPEDWSKTLLSQQEESGIKFDHVLYKRKKYGSVLGQTKGNK